MKSALGYAVVAALIGLGVLAYRGDLGNLIGGDTGKVVQETADKAKDVTKKKAAEAAAVAKDKLSKAKDVTAQKVAEATAVAKEEMAKAKDAAVKVKDVAVKKVKEVREAATDKVADKKAGGDTEKAPDPKQPGSTTAEKSSAVESADAKKSGIIEKAVDAVKKAVSVTEPSPIAWPVVSEEEFNKQREVRMAAKSSGSATASDSNAAEPQSGEASSGTAAAKSEAKMTPYERAKSAPEGSLKNPFDYKDPKIAAEGKKVYLKFSCNGCHGGGGGGGMCPPLTNETWVYGGDDDTLFRLITLGTDEFGKSRKGQETVVGPMPPYKDIIKDEEQMWKIIAYIRSVWGGRDKKIEW